LKRNNVPSPPRHKPEKLPPGIRKTAKVAVESVPEPEINPKILKMKANNQNPISILNEMYPMNVGPVPEYTCSAVNTGVPNRSVYHTTLKLEGYSYIGIGRTKKDAKTDAAFKCLEDMGEIDDEYYEKDEEKKNVKSEKRLVEVLDEEEVVNVADTTGSSSIVEIDTDVDDSSSIESSQETIKHSGFQYKFKSGKAQIHHSTMSVGDIVPVRCSTELSRQELKHFLKKDAEMKIFTDKSFDKSQESKYFKILTESISVKEYIIVRFEMTAIPRSTLDLRFQDLAQFVRGEVSAKLDRKISKKQETVLVATESIADKYVEIRPKETEKVKLRMTLNTRLKQGDEIKIQPEADLKVEIRDKSSWLSYEKSSHRLVTFVNVKNTSEKVLRMENGEDFGILKKLRGSLQNKMAVSFWRTNS